MHPALRATAAAAATLVLAGCGLAGGAGGAGDRAPVAGKGFPATVRNCGHDVRVDTRPRRVVALGPSEVTTLYAAGGAPMLVGRDDAGVDGPYPSALRTAVAKVPQLGHGGEITRENVIDRAPDLVVGSVSETVTPDTLGAVGIPMLSLAGNCGSAHAPGTGDGDADFDDVFADVTQLGRLLGTTDRSAAAVANMRERISSLHPRADLRGRSAATAIVFDDTVEVYGRRSMAHTQVQRLGLRNAFGNVDSRVFEASVEELISRDPDMIMLLSYGESDAQAKRKFLRLPGAAKLSAVRDRRLFVQPYEYSSQGTLSVTGLENMSRRLGR